MVNNFEEFDSDDSYDCCDICGDPLCPGCGSNFSYRILKSALLLVGIGIFAFISRAMKIGGNDSVIERSGSSAAGQAPIDQNDSNTSIATTTTFATTTTLATTTTTTVALTLPANVDQAWREEVLLLTNNERFKEGLNPLVGCDNLHRAAQTHSDAMHEQGFFEHDNPYTGYGVGERANRAGYEWASIGENIAMGQESPKAVVRAWMNSPGHRENILSDFKHLGVGITRGDSDINRKSSRIWWVQNFGFGGPCS